MEVSIPTVAMNCVVVKGGYGNVTVEMGFTENEEEV